MHRIELVEFYLERTHTWIYSGKTWILTQRSSHDECILYAHLSSPLIRPNATRLVNPLGYTYQMHICWANRCNLPCNSSSNPIDTSRLESMRRSRTVASRRWHCSRTYLLDTGMCSCLNRILRIGYLRMLHKAERVSAWTTMETQPSCRPPTWRRSIQRSILWWDPLRTADTDQSWSHSRWHGTPVVGCTRQYTSVDCGMLSVGAAEQDCEAETRNLASWCVDSIDRLHGYPQSYWRKG